ncbi:polysaccharide deacetylase family protein [Actinosynnema sp. NPDC047251]|uniref:Polysaccharide deacetylase n=1 Tax=Saccharothrix espanaensis (strain ATCC 51144 / DSM 44229 / JCM 9112 / NBRC 15066 / NRRL 15764) TaxID=1179773 RepID=K0K9Q9_SACES|nr:polysaccharide deacetylase family protein [Saccharothrix espanaensis]CCH34277.1 Polysaccharide deacetylase [Saccharothrix espanaensis DSM 44229]
MRRIRAAVAAALAVVTVSCGTAEPVAQPSTATTTTTTVTTTTPPTAVPGPGGVTVPVFQHPYRFGSAQAKVPAAPDGLLPVVRRIETDKPYVFITIDDGAVRHPAALELMRSSNVRPSLFLNTKHVQDGPPFFKALQDQAHAKVHAHTATHPNLQGKGYEFQKQEICGNADYLEGQLGVRPTLFRPPFGNYDGTTRRAATDCGFSALVMWTAAVNDGVVQFQAGGKLNAGDIVLMHFRQSFVEDFVAFLNRCEQDGLTPVPLEDFLSTTAP